MRPVKTLLALGAICAGLCTSASAAQANNVFQYHPTDPSYAHVWQDHWIEACDQQVDGHSVRAWFDTTAHPESYDITGWAPSGGCIRQASTLGWTIWHFRICIEDEGCSGWKSAL